MKALKTLLWILAIVSLLVTSGTARGRGWSKSLSACETTATLEPTDGNFGAGLIEVSPDPANTVAVKLLFSGDNAGTATKILAPPADASCTGGCDRQYYYDTEPRLITACGIGGTATVHVVTD